MLRYVSVFSVVTLLPAVLLLCSSTFGGFWTLTPLLLLGIISHICDELFESSPNAPVERLFQNLLPIALALLHFVLLAVAIWSITYQPFSFAEKTALLFGYALYFSHVSNAVGHELIHRRKRFQFTLGKWLFISILFGHHASSHRLIHHPYVATRYDPNTARFNENFYRFYVRAWRGSFLAGLGAENERLGYQANSRAVDVANPYFTYILGSFLCMGLAAGIAGWFGLAVYLVLAFLSQAGLLLTDYTQHYGLMRTEGNDGKFPPIAPHHSWNSQHWFTRNLTLNAPLHSDHHAKPAKPFTELQTHCAQTAPQLPYSPGIMSVIALYPPRWRKVMHPLISDWNTRHNRSD
jgi:alkane 1-monooxygenase